MPFSHYFYDSFTRACAEIKIPFLFSFSYLFSAVIDLLLGLLPIKKLRKDIIETGNFCEGVATCSGKKFCSEFSTQIF